MIRIYSEYLEKALDESTGLSDFISRVFSDDCPCKVDDDSLGPLYEFYMQKSFEKCWVELDD